MKLAIKLACDLILLILGALIGSLIWAFYLPDGPIDKDQCIPLYSSGLECCK